MKILYLETSSKNCSVAVSDGERLLCLCEENTDGYRQSENLHVFVQWALEGAGISLGDVEFVALGMGPGSYTGLRIGAAAAKGFCYGLKIPLAAVNSLETMALPFAEKGFHRIIPLVDARRKEVYTATYDGKTGEEISPTQALVLDENSFADFKSEKIIFVGDGAKKAREILTPNENFTFDENVFPSAKYLITSAVQKIKNREFEDTAYFEPFYLKDFHTTVQKKF